MKQYSYPVTPREAFKAALDGEAVWQITGIEKETFTPRIIPDNVARAFVLESKSFDALTQGGGKDMFGIEWVYVPTADGSMVKPGNPLLSDMNEWRDRIAWPNIESWDWHGSGRENNGSFLKPNLFNALMFQNGYFERLITFLDFEGALLALTDEEQKQATKDFFERLVNLYIDIFTKAIAIYPNLDAFEIHDDWGSQQNTFFSPAVVAEMIVPYMRKVNDFIHAQGLYSICHSCGNNIMQLENYVAAGYDAWNPQAMNDTKAIYDQIGDRLFIGVYDEPHPESTEDEQRTRARAYADTFCKPGKPSFMNMYSAACLTSSYWEELYVRSRINYSS
jgi:hypothetical protein